MKKYLFIELYPFKPHLETSCEIAIDKKKNGHDVTFVWLGSVLKWSEVKLTFFQKFLFCSYEKKINELLKLLKKNNITVIDYKNLDFKKLKKIEEWSLNFNGTINDLKKYKYNNQNLGIGVVSSLISYFHNSQFNTNKNFNIIKKCLQSSAIVYEITKIILKQNDPEIIVTFNNRFFATNSVILAAKKFNKKILRHERGSNFKKYEIFEKDVHDYKFRSSKILRYWKKSKCKNKEKIANSYFVKKRKGKSLGRDLGLNFTSYQKNNFNWEKKLKRIVYFTSTSYEHEAISYEIGKNYWNNQIEVIKDLIKVSKKFNLDFVVRMHPKPFKLKSNIDEEDIIDLCLKNNIRVIKPEEKISSYNLIDSSDYISHYGSNIGIEATYWNKISISFRKSYYFTHNVDYQPKNLNELKKLFLKKIKPKPKLNCLPHGFYFLTFGKNYKHFKPHNYYDISYKNIFYNYESYTYLILKKIFFFIKKFLQ